MTIKPIDGAKTDWQLTCKPEGLPERDVSGIGHGNGPRPTVRIAGEGSIVRAYYAVIRRPDRSSLCMGFDGLLKAPLWMSRRRGALHLHFESMRSTRPFSRDCSEGNIYDWKFYKEEALNKIKVIR